MKYKVVIKKYDGTVERVIAEGKSTRTADRIKRGACINLDTTKYFVEIEEEDDAG